MRYFQIQLEEKMFYWSYFFGEVLSVIYLPFDLTYKDHHG